MGISDTILIDRSRITEMIPQRPPVVMVNALHLCDDRATISSFSIETDNIFLEDGVLSASGLVENIAQTAAARVGYLAMKDGVPVPLGFIAAIKDLKIFNRPRIGDTLLTEVVVENTVMGMTIITGKSAFSGTAAAQCEMKIFINADGAAPDTEKR